MSEHLEKSVDRWLREESAAGMASAEGAEEALTALFAALPAPFEAKAGFVDGVMGRLPLPAVPVARDLGWRGRLATAAALLLVSFAAFWLLPWALALVAGFDAAALVASGADAMAFTLRSLGGLLVWTERLAGLLRAIWLLMSSPQIAAVWLLAAAMTFGMWRWLHALLATDRRALHVSR